MFEKFRFFPKTLSHESHSLTFEPKKFKYQMRNNVVFNNLEFWEGGENCKQRE